jgi:hypothetical protein
MGVTLIADHLVYRGIYSKSSEAVKHILEKIPCPDSFGLISWHFVRESEMPDAVILELKNSTNEIDFFIAHPKIWPISYPNEWCATMFYDAACFHLDFSIYLEKQELYLKDAHPWNILFKFTRPIFIDLTSVVDGPELLREDFLNDNEKNHINNVIYMAIKKIYKIMFTPYFIMPLLMYKYGEYNSVRNYIYKYTINTFPDYLRINNIFKTSTYSLENIIKTIISYLIILNVLLRLRKNSNIKSFYEGIKTAVHKLKPAIKSSDYESYYRLKNEDSDWVPNVSWNDKQRNIFNYVTSTNHLTYLDLACNTGWYSILAAKHGKSVVAIDIDEACVESLYKFAKQNSLSILPLVSNLLEESPDKKSLFDDGCVLINRVDRLRSDVVLALGLLHHMVLGQGIEVGQIIALFASYAKCEMIIEFVDLSDQVIIDEPSFFPAFHANAAISRGYSLDEVVLACKNLGFSVSCKHSTPETRTLLFCKRIELNA